MSDGAGLAAFSALRSVRSTLDFAERCHREGESYTGVGNNATSAVTVVTGAVNTSITGIIVPTTGIPSIGKVVWVDNVTFSLDNPALAQIILASDANARFNAFTWQGIVLANTPIIVPVNKVFHGYQLTTLGWSLAIRNNLTGGSVNYKGALGFNGWKLTDDFAWDANKTILFVGDSILNGTGPTTTAKMYSTIVREYYRTANPSVRMVLKSVSGSHSNDHETWRAGNYHDISSADLGFYCVSVNDAITGISTSTYTANLTAFWTWWHKRYPKAPLVILGTTPLEDNTAAAAAAALRTVASAYVTSVASPLLFYIDPSSAFTRTDTSFYVSTDSANNHIHPNDSGHAAIAAVITASLASQNIRVG